MNAQRESIVLHGAPVISSIISQRDRSCVRENFIETRGIHIHNAFLYREKVTVK